MQRQKLAGLALAALVIVLAAAPVEAHRRLAPPPAPVETPVEQRIPVVEPAALAWVAAPAPPSMPWPLALAVIAGSVAGLRWPRRTMALGLVLLAAVFAFENGVHSVHHLAEPGRGSNCPLALASQHVWGTEVSVVVVESAPVPLGATAMPEAPSIPSVRPFGLHEGRAPPLTV